MNTRPLCPLAVALLSVIAQAADSPLDLDITATPDPVRPGEQVIYQIVVSNGGTNDLAGVEASVVTPNHTSFTGSLNANPPLTSRTWYAGEVARWALGTVPAGTSRTIQLGVMVDWGIGATPPDGTLIELMGSVTETNGVTANGSLSTRVGPLSPNFVGIPTLTANGVELRLHLQRLSQCRIDASFDLKEWSPLTNMIPATFDPRVVDPDFGLYGHRFYRAVLP